MERMNPLGIKTHDLFKGLFPVRRELLDTIERDMREGSYDLSQPVILATWQGQEEPVCIDGHTRLKAAINAGIDELPVWRHDFDNEDEAIEKAIKLQRNRRNLTDADIIAFVEALDSRRPRGGDRRSEAARSKPQPCGIENPGRSSAEELAEKLGIKPRKVEKARVVLDEGDPETLAAISAHEKSIHKASEETQAKRRALKAERKTAAESTTSDQDPKSDGEKQNACFVDIPAGQDEEAQDSDTRVKLSPEQYEDLSDLGGSIEEHVARAVARYLHHLQCSEPDDYEDFDYDDYDD